MNKSTLATILGTAALGFLKSSGSKNDGVRIEDIDELLEYANDPNKAHLVTEVNLENNNLTSLPPEIGNLTNLKWLHLNNNNLTSLPPEIGNLSNLKYLYLYINNLTSLPPEIGNLTNLEVLDFADNNLAYLPKEIGNLSHLEELELDGTNIQMPSRNTIQYWMNNLKPDVLQKIFQNMKPSSQLRRF
jgi:Leucine-rich repeat (LRR) protein